MSWAEELAICLGPRDDKLEISRILRGTGVVYHPFAALKYLLRIDLSRFDGEPSSLREARVIRLSHVPAATASALL
jgi:hypothetical protein